MNRLSTLTKEVKEALEKYPKTRDDDMFLYGCILKVECPEVLHMEVRDMLHRHKELKVPSLESVTRCRRKIQEEFPQLKSKLNKTTEEEKYIQYSRENVGSMLVDGR